MNDDRFIEQLNAYIDRELSGDEIRELETEIASSPERQKIYRSYCKIDRACQGLLAREAAHAPKPSIAAIVAAAESQGDGKVVDFSSSGSTKPYDRNSGLSWGTAFAGLAAACLAAVIYIAGPQRGDGDFSPEIASPEVAASKIGTDDSMLPETGQAYRTVFALDTQNRGDRDSFAWMTQLEFAPIQPIEVDALEFKTAQPLKVRTLSAYAYPYPGLDDTPPLSETAAFQFQR